MNKNKKQPVKNFVWLPNAAQELLLKSALLENSSAVKHWEKWKNAVNPYEAGFAEKRFFPLVYHNLQTLGYVDEYTGMLKTAHRDSFKKTVTVLQNAGRITEALSSGGVQTILLKGVALAVHYYPSIALRPMADIDILIKPEDILAAIKILNELGWETQERNLTVLFEIVHSGHFLDDDNQELDLHWRLMCDCWNANKTEIFWESAIPLKYQIINSRALCATDQLFHVCCHGARYNNASPIRWVADAIRIIKNPLSEIDWERLIALAKLYRLSLPLFHALSYLQISFDAQIPPRYLVLLEKNPTTLLERTSFKNFSEPPQKWTFWRYVEELAFQYSSLRSSTTLNPRSLVFVKYLQSLLTIERIDRKFFRRINKISS